MTRVLFVVGLAELVALFDVFFDTHSAVFSELCNVVEAVLDGCIEVDAEHIFAFFAENMVRAASDDDAGILCELENNLFLCFIDSVIGTAVGNSTVQNLI